MYFCFLATVPFKSIRLSPVHGRNWKLVPVLSSHKSRLKGCILYLWLLYHLNQCGRPLSPAEIRHLSLSYLATKAGWRDVFCICGYCTIQINSAIPCPRPKLDTSVLSKPSAGLCSCHQPGWFRNIHKYCRQNWTLVPVLFWPPWSNWLNWYSNVHQYSMQADH